MEVHAHTHTARKKWTHYFWEFFMLFLAVTLGFFVENKREHYIEHKREKEYIRQLAEDLKTDTAFFSEMIRVNDRNQQRMDSLMRLFRDYRPPAPSNDLYYLARLVPSMGISPQYSNRTFEQLKNSGMLRLIRKTEVLDSITRYYESLKELDIRGTYRMERLNNLFTAGEELFDGYAFSAIADSGFTRLAATPPLLSNEPKLISRYITRLGYFRVTDKVIRERIRNLYQPAATRLLSLLNSSYHLH